RLRCAASRPGSRSPSPCPIPSSQSYGRRSGSSSSTRSRGRGGAAISSYRRSVGRPQDVENILRKLVEGGDDVGHHLLTGDVRQLALHLLGLVEHLGVFHCRGESILQARQCLIVKARGGDEGATECRDQLDTVDDVLRAVR